MVTERDWLMKQEQINDQLRQRAAERAHPLSDDQRRRSPIRTLLPRIALRRKLASAARPLPAGG